MIDVWQYSEYVSDSEYVTVLNILGLHKAVNKTFHQRYLTGFASVTQDSVKSAPSYMFDRVLSIPWALSMLGHKYTKVVNMPRFCVNCILKILSILNVLSSEYAKILNVTGV